MSLSREQLDVIDTGRGPTEGSELVSVPEYAGEVRLAPLLYHEVKEIAEIEKGGNDSDPYVFSCTLIDDDGKRLFEATAIKNYYALLKSNKEPDKPEDLYAIETFLRNLTASTYRRLNRTLARMNGLSRAGREDIEGN